MQQIKLPHGLCAVVDDADYELVSQFKWGIQVAADIEYAVAHTDAGMVLMHRLILGLEHGDPRLVRHVNTSGFDNRQSNLQVFMPGHLPDQQPDDRPLLRRTWDDFVENAYYLFGNIGGDALGYHMGRHRLTSNQVVCYINWTVGMNRWDIALSLGKTTKAVERSLEKLKAKWPFLFSFMGHQHTLVYKPDVHDKYVVRQF